MSAHFNAYEKESRQASSIEFVKEANYDCSREGFRMEEKSDFDEAEPLNSECN